MYVAKTNSSVEVPAKLLKKSELGSLPLNVLL
jgi:hypothetical protein